MTKCDRSKPKKKNCLREVVKINSAQEEENEFCCFQMKIATNDTKKKSKKARETKQGRENKGHRKKRKKRKEREKKAPKKMHNEKSPFCFFFAVAALTQVSQLV